MPNRHNIAIANLFPLASIESGRKSLVFQKNLYFLARQSHVTQAAQAHFMNADVTLACERCCVTNGYLQRLVWDANGFFLKVRKNVIF